MEKSIKMSKCIIIYGPSKIGISSFLSEAENSIFINPGRGIKHLDCNTIKDSSSFKSIMDAVTRMINAPKGKFPFKYVIVDHLIGLEHLIFKHVCEEQKISHVDYFNYGKGHQIAFTMLWTFLMMLEDLATAKDITIFLVGHSTSETNTTLFQENLTKQVLLSTIKPPKDNAREALKIWSDALLYVDDYKAVCGGYTAESILEESSIRLFTQQRPSFDAGNRFDWDFQVPLDWKSFEEKCLIQKIVEEPTAELNIAKE